MDYPRGLRACLLRTAPCKLKKGKYAHFCDRQGVRYKGLTKQLGRVVFTDGSIARGASSGFCPSSWRGENGGRRRGAAVDAQFSKSINKGVRSAQKGQYVFTRMLFAALDARKLVPVVAQRPVSSSASNNLATAIDILAFDADKNRLVILEIKCGHQNDKFNQAKGKSGENLFMRPHGFKKVADTHFNRHLAQLSVTHHMFLSEKSTFERLNSIGIEPIVDANLVYVDNTVRPPTSFFLSHHFPTRATRGV